MEQLQVIENQRLYRVIADQFAEKIRNGELKVGDRLPAERELAVSMGVSRPTIREAFIALEIQGYVDVRVGTGVFVCSAVERTDDVVQSQPSQQPDVSPFDLLKTRMMLEPDSAALAAKNASEAQLRVIRTAHDSMNLQKGVSHVEDRAFHMAIAAASGNAVLEGTLEHLWNLCEASQMYRQLEAHFVSLPVWRLVKEEHRLVMSAILERDPERARHAMQSHLFNISERLREDLNSNRSIQRAR